MLIGSVVRDVYVANDLCAAEHVKLRGIGRSHGFQKVSVLVCALKQNRQRAVKAAKVIAETLDHCAVCANAYAQDVALAYAALAGYLLNQLFDYIEYAAFCVAVRHIVKPLCNGVALYGGETYADNAAAHSDTEGKLVRYVHVEKDVLSALAGALLISLSLIHI